MKKTNISPSGSTAINNNNYFHPLQTLDDNDEQLVTKTTKQHIPPLTVLKCRIEQLHELCKKCHITNYAIRKISIGLKLFCQTQEDFDNIAKNLSSNKFEFFTYATKSDRPYKALLFGLEKTDVSELKTKLIKMGLECIDVKMVQRSGRGNTEHLFYVVYFKRQSITLKELRQNYSSIEYLKVKWEFHRNRSNKVTQCYNCQMFGHGSSRCAVKSFCSKCSGTRKTDECTSDIIKCANCGANHQSSSPDCPNRKSYIEIKQRIMNKNSRFQKRSGHVNGNSHVSSAPNHSGNNSQFPALHTGAPPVNGWSNLKTNKNNNDLLSFDEIKNITFELINKLKACKCKLDQFEVVSSIAFKFLS